MFMRNVFILSSVLFVLLLTGCSSVANDTQNTSQSEVVASSPEVLPQTTLELEAEIDGQLVADLTESRHQVEYKEYDFGVMVESIDGLRADSNHYWALYVNDEYGEAGAKQLKVNQGDRIKWVYEEIK